MLDWLREFNTSPLFLVCQLDLVLSSVEISQEFQGWTLQTK